MLGHFKSSMGSFSFGRSQKRYNLPEITLISYIYPKTMTEMNVSTTMGMSATVVEMSATVGKLNMV